MCRIGLVVVILSIVYTQYNVNAVDILDFPYMAAVLFREWETSVFRYQCNGVIISNKHVLTTAMCIGDSLKRDIKVRVGSTFPYKRGRIHTVDIVRKHFKFSNNLDADIAVLTLSEPVKLGYQVAVVKIPEQDAIIKTMPQPQNGVLDKTIITNITYYTDGELNRCSTNSLQLETTVGCNRYLRTELPFKDLVTENMLCLFLIYFGDCSSFDSLGAPLVINETVYGIYSWGRWGDSSFKVFTRVSAFSEWIKNF